MIKRYKHTLSLLVVILLAAISSVEAFAAAQVVMPRGKNSIGVDDVFYVKVSPAVSGLEGFDDFPGAGVLYFQKNYENINGHATSSVVITLRAKEKGSFKASLPGVGMVSYTIGSGGGNSAQPSSNSQNQTTVKIDADPAKVQGGPKFIGKGNSQLFMRASLSRNSAYEQEALTYTVKLYCSYDGIRFIGATATPTFDGFTVEETNDVSTQWQFETYEGKTYKTAVIARYVLFPQIAGNLKVIGNTYTVAVDEAEYYSDPYYSHITVRRPLQLNVTPNDLTLDVKPLPSPKPANFSGGVGKFSITSSLPEQKFATNRAASIVYTITGRGNIKYVKMPDLNGLYPQQLEVFDPTTDVKSEVSGGTLAGSVKYDYSFTPLETGNYNIPAVELVYFNPETGQYETATAQGYKIHVEQGTASDKSQTKARLKFDDNLLPVGALAKEYQPLVRSFAYWLVYIVVVLALCVILFLYRRRIKELSDLSLLRSKKAASVARKRLKKAAAFMRKGEREQFYTEMLHATWGFLSDRLHIPQSELNRDNVRQALTDAGCDEKQCDDLITLLDDCEFAKYASASGAVDMQTIYDRGTQIINHFADTINVTKQS